MSGYEPLLRPLVYPVPAVRVPAAPPPLAEVILHLPDGTPIVGWSLRAVDLAGGGRSAAGGDARPVALYLHGNGENLETMRQCGLFAALVAAGVDVLAIDYPGYGRSGGRPDEQTLGAAAAAGFAHLARWAPGRPRLIIGFSLGSAVAVQLAASASEARSAAVSGAQSAAVSAAASAHRPAPGPTAPGAIAPGAIGAPADGKTKVSGVVSVAAATGVAGLVLCAPWTRLAELAAVHVPAWVSWAIPGWIYDSLDAAGRVRVPTLVVHGEADDIIPVAQGRQVFARLPRGSRLITLAGPGHNDLLGDPRCWQAITDYVAAVSGGHAAVERSPG